MELLLQDIVELTGGLLHGDPNVVCQGANPPSQSSAQEITMVMDWDQVNLSTLTAAVVLTQDVEPKCLIDQIVVPDAHASFAKVVAQFRPPIAVSLPGVGVDSGARIAGSAKIHPTATVGKNVAIGSRTIIMPGVVIMPGCRIGDDCILHAGVTLYENTQLGDRVILHAGTVCGANGFGYRQEKGRHLPSAQLGFVKIESDVEVGASVTIDRGSYGATLIGEGTKIDNQVMIAHNCQIGKHNLICSQVGIAGSCTTGDHVVLAGQVGLKDHITLGDHTVVGAQAGVMDDCDGGQVYLGSPAMPQRDQMQVFALQRRLPEMRRDLKRLAKQVETLSQQLQNATQANADSQATVVSSDNQPNTGVKRAA